MQSVSSRIWTRVAVSISDDDNYYTTGTFINYGPRGLSPQAAPDSWFKSDWADIITQHLGHVLRRIPRKLWPFL